MLSERTVLSERAWPNSDRALPAQASMLTGVFPPKHGALDRDWLATGTLGETPLKQLADIGYTGD